MQAAAAAADMHRGEHIGYMKYHEIGTQGA
jgi:hypothetical protein